MDFTYDDEQLALRDAVRGMLGKKYGDFEERRRTVAADPGYDPSMWRQLAEMGILGLPFAEDDGGTGAGPVEVGLVAHELGRVLAPEPFLASVVLAGGLVAAAGTAEQRAGLLGGLAAGERVLGIAHAAPSTRWGTDPGEVRADGGEGPEGSGWRLTGTKEPVLPGFADLFVVSAALPDGGTGLFLVEAEQAQVTGYRTYDGQRAARLDLEGTVATPLGEPGTDQTRALAAVLDAGRVAACHEALGGMEVALAATTGYLKSRKQFGVPLNTFQALNFRAADMYVTLELTTSLVQWATMVQDAGDRDATAVAAARASLQVSRAGRHIGQEAIQLHGGIGMTAEYLVGNIASHLTALDHLLGDGQHHLQGLALEVDGYDLLDPLAPTIARASSA